MLEFLFNLIVKPLQLLFEFVFSNTYSTTDNILLSIFTLSFIVSILCLPLYLRADELQEEENEIQKKLSKKVNSIKKNFKGDERQLLLQTYYKQNGYHPIMGLRLSLSLFLQIPIFMAAYSYFSNLSLLEGSSFWLIENLAMPDGLIQISDIKINGLPILMTLISLLASVIYSKSKNIKESKALIVVNLIFLGILYNSPSALVFYWLFNNLFSLIKNICLTKISRRNLIKASLIGAFIFYYILHKLYSLPLDILVAILAIALIFQCSKIKNLNLNFNYKKLFILSIITLWVILGILIPSNVISSSPSEFSFQDGSPLSILLYVATIFFGLIIFWGLWIYYFANIPHKKILALCTCLVVACSIVNLCLLKVPLSVLLNTMNFAIPDFDFMSYPVLQRVLHAIVTILVCTFILIELIKKNRAEIINKFILVTLISAALISVCNFTKILTSTQGLQKEENVASKKEEGSYIRLSSTHKNVIIIFVDRAVGAFLPKIFGEHPELKEKYEGFVYYPNTLSFAGYTLLSYPALLGGYEYTPSEMDASDKVFEEEYREALALLPKIFSDNAWQTTVINPMGAEWESSLKDGVRQKDIKTLGNTTLYKNSDIRHLKIPNSIIYDIATKEKVEITTSDSTKRNLAYFSIFSIVPPSARRFLYDNGNYHQITPVKKQSNKIYDKFFLKNYAELLSLEKFTTISEENNTFTIFNNSLPHFPTHLSYPDYGLSNTDENKYPTPVTSSEWNIKSYLVNAATIKFIGEYLDYLKMQFVYNNTRIIIVADHGFVNLNTKAQFDNAFQKTNVTPFNPLLLVKDFGANGEFRTSNEFMTNADVPTLATKFLIQNPKNPYTSKEINSSAKNNGIVIIKNNNWKPEFYLGKKHIFNKKDNFNFVKGDPANYRNWKIDLNFEEIKKEINTNSKN